MTRNRLVSVLAILVFEIPCALSAASPSRQYANPNGRLVGGSTATPGPNYGLAGTSLLSLAAWDFHPIDSTTTYAYDVGTFGIHVTAGQFLEAPVHLPAGVLVTGATVDYCDTNGADDLKVSFAESHNSDNGGGTLYTTILQTSGTPGCAVFTGIFGSPIQIDNLDNFYTIETNSNGATDSSITLSSVKVIYMLQISPPPGTPTFSDVGPGDPAWPFVEAFVAAGITVGCDAGPPARYCPDDPVTRRQAAVFVGKALGLYWPN